MEHRVVIVGGGVAGLDIAGRLRRHKIQGRRLSVTLVDKEPAHVWKPMLHTIAAGTRDAVTQQTPYLVQAFKRGFVYQPGEVTAVNPATRTIDLAAMGAGEDEWLPSRQIDYDTLILAVGSVVNDFGTPGVREHCFAINTRADAIAFSEVLQVRLRRAFARETAFDVVIIGAGATGVELAAEIVQLVEIVEDLGLHGFGSGLTVTLVEAGDRILAAFPETVSKAAHGRLERMGVRVRTAAKVQEVGGGGVQLADGQRISSDMTIWAAGVQAPPFVRAMEGVEHSRRGQVVVGGDLVSTTDRRILAIGDCAAPRLSSGKPVPTTAQAAYQAALYLSAHLPALIEGRAVSEFRYRDFGGLVSLGGFDAYGTLGKFGLFGGGFLKGRVAQLGHTLLYRRHQVQLHGYIRAGLLWVADLIGDRVTSRARIS